MTISPWLVYFWGQADAIREGLLAFSLGVIPMFVGFGFIAFMVLMISDRKTNLFKTLKTHLIVVAIVALLSGTASMLLPSSKTISLMVIVPAIVNSQPIQKDIPELYTLGVQALKEKMYELADKKVDEAAK